MSTGYETLCSGPKLSHSVKRISMVTNWTANYHRVLLRRKKKKVYSTTRWKEWSKNGRVVFRFCCWSSTKWVSLVGNLKPTPSESNSSKSDLPSNSCAKTKLNQPTLKKHRVAEFVHLTDVLMHEFWLLKFKCYNPTRLTVKKIQRDLLVATTTGSSQQEMWIETMKW